MTLIKRLLAISIILFLLLVASLSFLLYSEPGLALSVALIKKMLPGKLQVDSLQGSLMGKLRIKKLSYQNGSLSLQLSNVSMAMNPLALFAGRLRIKSFSADRMKVQLNKITLTSTQRQKQKTAAPASLLLQHLPIQFTVTEVNIHDAIFQQRGKIRVHVIRLRAQLTTRTKDQRQQFNLRSHWQRLQWISLKNKTHSADQARRTAPAPALLTLNNSAGTLIGTTAAWQLTLHSQVRWQHFPSLALQLSAAGNGQSLHLDNMTLHGKAGTFITSGSLRWLPNLVWNINVTAKKVNPHLFVPALSGHLQMQLQSNGSLANKQRQLHLQINNLTGELNQQPVKGRLNISAHNHTLHISQAYLNMGKASVCLHGDIARRWQISWAVHIPQLQAFNKHSRGSLHSTGTINGSEIAPLIRADINGKNLHFANSSIAAIQGKLILDLAKKGKSLIQFTVRQLNYHHVQIHRMNMEASGSGNHNRTHITIKATGFTADTTLTGALSRSGWRGLIKATQINSNAFGNWSNQHNAALIITLKDKNSEIALRDLCLHQHNQAICVTVHWQPALKLLKTNMQIKQLALEKLVRYFSFTSTGNTAENHPGVRVDKQLQPQHITTNSRINGHIKLQANAGQLSGAVSLILSPGTVAFINHATSAILHLEQSKLQASLHHHTLLFDTSINLSQQQKINATLSISNINNQRDNKVLHGNIQLHYHQIAVISKLYPELISQASGTLNANLAINGTMTAPQLQGRATLKQGNVTLVKHDVTFNHISLTVTGTQQGLLTIHGTLQTGKTGKLRLHGELNVTKKGLPARLILKGENLQLSHSPSLQLMVAPDLTLNKLGRQINVHGTIMVIKARIARNDFLTQSHTLPEDVTFVQHDNTARIKLPYHITSNIKLILGQHVEVHAAAGLTGKLTGNLTIHYDSTTPGTANGTLSIINGNYNAYGQLLKIATGKLIYTGGPLDNPGLDLAAVRTLTTTRAGAGYGSDSGTSMAASYSHFSQVTVGVRIKGTLKNKKISLFSKPASYSQSDILSLLLTGKPAADLSKDKAGLLMRAASSLNPGGSAVGDITQDLQKRFGLDELGLQTETVENQGQALQTTALVVGKRLAKNLYLSYSIGLFNPISVVKVRYQFAKNWNIQTRASTAVSGIDLFYSFER